MGYIPVHADDHRPRDPGESAERGPAAALQRGRGPVRGRRAPRRRERFHAARAAPPDRRCRRAAPGAIRRRRARGGPCVSRAGAALARCSRQERPEGAGVRRRCAGLRAADWQARAALRSLHRPLRAPRRSAAAGAGLRPADAHRGPQAARRGGGGSAAAAAGGRRAEHSRLFTAPLVAPAAGEGRRGETDRPAAAARDASRDPGEGAVAHGGGAATVAGDDGAVRSGSAPRWRCRSAAAACGCPGHPRRHAVGCGRRRCGVGAGRVCVSCAAASASAGDGRIRAAGGEARNDGTEARSRRNARRQRSETCAQ